MTKLLADSLGGNALTVMIATLRQGEFSESEAVLKLLQVRTHNPIPAPCSDHELAGDHDPPDFPSSS